MIHEDMAPPFPTQRGSHGHPSSRAWPQVAPQVDGWPQAPSPKVALQLERVGSLVLTW
jgi:hypothetical protein